MSEDTRIQGAAEAQLPSRAEVEAQLQEIDASLEKNAARRAEIELTITSLRAEAGGLVTADTELQRDRWRLGRVLQQITKAEERAEREATLARVSGIYEGLSPAERLAIVEIAKKEPVVKPPPLSNSGWFNENLDRSVYDLELSVRSANALQNTGIDFIGDLVQRSEADMLRIRNFGRKSLKEIKEILREMGLSLGMVIPGWERPST